MKTVFIAYRRVFWWRKVLDVYANRKDAADCTHGEPGVTIEPRQIVHGAHCRKAKKEAHNAV